jgi:hypothetical protein
VITQVVAPRETPELTFFLREENHKFRYLLLASTASNTRSLEQFQSGGIHKITRILIRHARGTGARKLKISLDGQFVEIDTATTIKWES